MKISKIILTFLFTITALVVPNPSAYAQSKEPVPTETPVKEPVPTETPGDDPDRNFWSNTTAVFFDAGIHNNAPAYISFISVAYTDGSNEFQTSFTPWTYTGALVDGGRRTWTLKNGIKIKFDLDGYGRRECTVSTSSRYAFWSYTTVTYLGNNTCSIK
ncbi:hypothetical protein [Herpetosiphon geysericola]|uniref:Uncharacterized protein n=1 Tax=Herpetosiphon geysericola TaxID=70996 RepID=A0A0P6XB56_9CHLR|nr:hypothetical protein [Herpetosiphon geysericola]KPL79981.1 hypothetical protein SE18_25680 [Herpetosiphon geysericola]